MKEDIVECKKKEEEKQLELSELMSVHSQKCSELDELKVDNGVLSNEQKQIDEVEEKMKECDSAMESLRGDALKEAKEIESIEEKMV